MESYICEKLLETPECKAHSYLKVFEAYISPSITISKTGRMMVNSQDNYDFREQMPTIRPCLDRLNPKEFPRLLFSLKIKPILRKVLLGYSKLLGYSISYPIQGLDSQGANC